jgi:hypothetical protein
VHVIFVQGEFKDCLDSDIGQKEQYSAMGWIIREYEKGDEEGICHLLSDTFGTFTLDEWKWKYRGDYLPNPAWIDLGVDDSGKIVGHYVSLPRILHIENREYLVAMPCDYAVDIQYRRSLKKKGIAVAVFERQMELQKEVEEKVYLGFGYVNRAHYRVGKRLLNYQDLCVIHTLGYYPLFSVPKSFSIIQIKYIRDLIWRFFMHYKRVELKRAMASWSKQYSVKRIENFGSEIDRLYEKFSKLYPVGLKMDAAYLNGRFFSRPDVDYGIFTCSVKGETLGYVICRVKENCGILVDLVSLNDSEVTRCLIERAFLYFANKRINTVRGLFLPDSFLYEELIKYGFSWTKEITNVVYWIFFKDEIDEPKFTDLTNWHITYGTFDDM